MTKELSLFDTLLSTGTKSSGETKVSKEGSSLFDDLLKSVATQSQTSQSPIPTVSTQTTSVNTSQPLITADDGAVEQVAGEVVKTEQQTSVQANAVKKHTQLKSDSVNVQADFTQPKIAASSGSENIVDVDLSRDNPISVVTDKPVLTDGQNNGDATVIKPKQETKNSKILESTKNIEKQVDNDSKVSDTTSNVVQSVVSRTPSVLDKIQVEKQNKNVVDVEDILKNNTVLVADNKTFDLKTEFKAVVEQNNSGISTKTAEVNTVVPQHTEQVVTEPSKESVVESKLKQGVEVVKFDGSVSDTVSHNEKAVDLFTSLTTQNTTKTSIIDTSTKLSGDEKQYVNGESIIQNIVVSTDMSNNDNTKTVSTTTTPISQESQQQITQPIEQNIQVVNSITNENGNVISDKKQLTKESLLDVTGETVLPDGVTAEKSVVKNQEVVVGNVVSSDETASKIRDVETNLQNQVREVNNQPQRSISVNDSVTPKVNIDNMNKTSEIVTSNDVTVENVSIDDIKSNVVTDSKKTEATSINKQNAAVELAKLNTNEAKPIELVIDDKLKDATTKAEQPISKSNISLLDKLIEDSVKVTTKDSSQTVEKIEIKNGQILENAKTQDNVQKNDIMENIYKSSVSKNISLAAMQNATVAKETLKNANSIQDIQKSADMLELNLEGIEEVKIQDAVVGDTKQRAVNINRAFLEKNFVNKDNLIEKDSQTFDIEHKQTSVTDTKTTTNNMIQKVVELTIGEAEVLTIQNRIIGARQQLSSMMSDVARAMYENYKPPHTAFRISLNPANLGSIAILIRSQRADNSLSISMNMSSSSTLESVVANQNELRSALQKTFNDNSSFEFDFKLDPDASGSGFQNESFSANEQNHESKEDERDTFVASSEIIEEIQEVQKSGTYF
ncbi:MAG: flagellar hook-length control protein FliK [Campylobacterota bacterium]